jgi:hypothetical protein
MMMVMTMVVMVHVCVCWGDIDRAVHTHVTMSAIMNATAWCWAMGLPMVLRCSEYAMASSIARRAKPTAPAATAGRVKSNAFIAILKPKPTSPVHMSVCVCERERESACESRRWRRWRQRNHGRMCSERSDSNSDSNSDSHDSSRVNRP